MSIGSIEFWRKNVRPGTSFGPFSRSKAIWQRLCDWFAPSSSK